MVAYYPGEGLTRFPSRPRSVVQQKQCVHIAVRPDTAAPVRELQFRRGSWVGAGCVAVDGPLEWISYACVRMKRLFSSWSCIVDIGFMTSCGPSFTTAAKPPAQCREEDDRAPCLALTKQQQQQQQLWRCLVNTTAAAFTASHYYSTRPEEGLLYCYVFI